MENKKLKDIKLIVCDIDNTLVVKRQDLTQRGMNVIHQLRNKGILFGLASGRGTEQLKTFEDKWNIKCDVLIGMNGAEIYDGIDQHHEIYYDMEAEWIEECFKIMEPFNTRPHLVRNGMMLARKSDSEAQASAKYAKNTNPVRLVEDDSEFWEDRAIKFGFRVSAEDMPAIEKAVAQHPSDNWIGFKTETTMFEFGNKQANKGKLLKLFCEKHHIPIEQTCAFGDMTNDISMLVEAGIGVCMLNGSDDAKAVSDYITDKGVNEDGFADFVEKYIL
ncbi:MAG: Cof-type HAD-IIB family hydrolase [Traorella sp.]